MSVKHLKKYYKEVCDVYMEMVDNLKDFEEMTINNIIEPERLEDYKKEIQPVKSNWQTLSYIIYLLNLPNKKSKQPKYKKQNEKLLNISKGKQQQDIINESKEALGKSQKLIKK